MQHIEQWSPGDLIPYAKNPRKNDDAVDQMVGIISSVGFRVPLIIRSTGDVIDGHLRLKAAIRLGMDTIPCVIADDLSEAQIRALRISVNKAAELASWDDELLKFELLSIDELGFDIGALGFDVDELDKLVFEDEQKEKPKEGAGESKSAPAGHHLSFGKYKVAATGDEVSALGSALERYEDEHGTEYGFVDWLVGGRA